ncbi:hypothetical protein ACB098_08G022200 [Castanea mollissima]
MQKILNLFCRKQNMQQQKYSPWTYMIEIATDITLSSPVSTDYVENLELVLQKREYATAEIQPMDIHHRNNNRYIVFLWVRIDASIFFECTFQVCFMRVCFLSVYFSYMAEQPNLNQSNQEIQT